MSSLPSHVAFRVELAEILSNAAALYTRIKECKADQQTHETLAEYPIPDDLGTDNAEKQRHFEGELQSILEHLVNYDETSLSTLKCFYVPGDAQDIANYGQGLIDWISAIRKHLIHLKVETTKIMRKDKGHWDSDISEDYAHRLTTIYHSTSKLEYWLKIKYKPLSNPRRALVPSVILPDLGFKPNDGPALTERLDKIRNALNTFQASHPEFANNLFRVHRNFCSESSLSPLSTQSSNAIYQAVNKITAESLPRLLSTAKAGCQEVLAKNDSTFHGYLDQQLQSSSRLIHSILGVTNAALISVPEGEIIGSYDTY